MAKILFNHNCALNSSANIIYDTKTKKEIRQGSQTECGLLQFLVDQAVDYNQIRSVSTELGSVPFSSERKRMTTVVAHPTEASKVRVYVKGASEIVLNRCTHILKRNDEIALLSQEEREKILKNVINVYASQAYRAIGFAYRDMNKEEFEEKDLENVDDMSFLESELIFVAIAGIQDPLRQGIEEAVKQCKRSGITVRMVTGDNIETAKAISRNAQILTQKDEGQEFSCMEGKQFREYVGEIIEETDPKTGKKVERPREI